MTDKSPHTPSMSEVSQASLARVCLGTNAPDPAPSRPGHGPPLLGSCADSGSRENRPVDSGDPAAPLPLLPAHRTTPLPGRRSGGNNRYLPLLRHRLRRRWPASPSSAPRSSPTDARPAQLVNASRGRPGLTMSKDGGSVCRGAAL